VRASFEKPTDQEGRDPDRWRCTRGSGYMHGVIDPRHPRPISKRSNGLKVCCRSCQPRHRCRSGGSIRPGRTALDRCIRICFPGCCFRVKIPRIAESVRSRTKRFTIALGVQREGEREFSACGLPTTKGPSFWLSWMTTGRNRGVEEHHQSPSVDGPQGLS